MINKQLAIVMTIGAVALTGCGATASTNAASAPGAAAPAVSAAASAKAPAGVSAAAKTPGASATATKTAAKAARASATSTASRAAGKAAAAARTAVPAKGAAAPAAAVPAAAVPAAAVPAAAVPAGAVPAGDATAAAPVKAPAAPAPAPAPAPAKPAPALVAPVATAGNGVQAATAHGWGPVVSGDEFSYTGAPDRTKWSVYNSKGHAGKGIRSRDQVKVGSGVLTITGDASGKTGGMSAKATMKYGTVETRMRVSHNDPQYHPVLILHPINHADAYSGHCWEIDYAEGNKGPGLMSFFNHIACSGTKHTWARKALDTRQWHNYAVEWTPTGITGYIDGVKTFSDTNPAHISNVTMHQTLQLDWFPDGSALSASQMQVDWVRVYK